MSVAGSLSGKTALITGAAAGIGAATATLFAEAGAQLALCDRDPCNAPDGGVVGAFDVRDHVAVEAFVTEVVGAFGSIDLLVNNAGGTFASPFLDVSEKGQAALIAENFTQVAHFIRAVVPHMAQGASIVNVTSIEAHRAGPEYAVYSAMKAAVASLTKTLALELAPKGIRVNAVAPDVLFTDGELGGLSPAPDHRYKPSPTPPLGHYGEPQDGAAAIWFLSSDLARFITGISLLVDGGNDAAGGWHRQA